MTWKYAVRECRMHIVMSVLCLIQAVFLFAIVTGLLSIFMIRYEKYQPVQKLVEQKGFICNLLGSHYIEGEHEEKMVETSQAYKAMLKDAEVCGQYDVNAFVEETQEVADARKEGSFHKNVRAYDDGWISGYAPKLQSGSWLKTGNKEGKYLEAVVLQNRERYKTGDVVYVDTNSETELQTKIPVKIIGVIDRNADIIFQSNGEDSVDYHILFSNMIRQSEDVEKLDDITGDSIFPPTTFFVSKKNLDRVQEQYVDQEAEKNLSENNNKVPNTDKKIFFTKLSGLALITIDKKCPDKLYGYNKNRVAQISDFYFLHDLDYIKKNTWQNIMADISDLIPAGVGMILFTIISFVTLSTLMYQKNMKKYSIYYVQGLTWKRIFRIHILYISLIILTALVLGILMSLAAGHFGIWSGLAVQLGGVQITGCLIITILLLASSALMCLSLVKGRSAKEILQGGEI